MSAITKVPPWDLPSKASRILSFFTLVPQRSDLFDAVGSSREVKQKYKDERSQSGGDS